MEDGLFYMYPSSYEDDYVFEIDNPENWSEAQAEARFFGFVITTFALNALCFHLYANGSDNSYYVDMYHSLIQYFYDKLAEAEETEDEGLKEQIKAVRSTFFKLTD